MPNHADFTPGQKKKLLIAQGAMHRLALSESTNIVRANLRPDALASSALNGLSATVSAAIGQAFSLKNIGTANFQTVLPILISGVSLLSKRRALIKPVVIGVIIFATVNAIARFVIRKKIERQHKFDYAQHGRS